MIIKKDIVVLDLETTGFNEFEDDIIEVGLVKFNGETGEMIATYNELVKTDKKLSKKIIELTGITDEMLEEDGKDKEQVKHDVQNLCEDSVIVAHNVQFDFKFIKIKYDIEPKLFYDTLAISKLEYPHFNNHKLETLCFEFDVDLSNAHRALHDAEATKDILVSMLNNKPDVAKKYINALANNKYGISYKPKHTMTVFN